MIQQQGSERPTTSGSYKSEQDTTIRVHAVDAALLSRSSCVSQPKPTMHPHSWHPVPSPTTSASPPLAHPQRSIAQYSQKVELYRGSVSTVYKALDDVTGTKVILKCYHKKKMQAKHYNKLDREIKAMVALRGPFVAELTSWFQDEDSVWLAMELCEGGDLFKSLMLHGGRLDEHYVCTEIIAPLLRVLEKSHAMNIMHRDIKPENLFLTRYQKIRVGDFGLAVDWSKELPFSRSGTLDYMAPEVLRNPASQLQESSDVTLEQLQAKGIKPYDEKVDVWAVGVLAYEMVVGKPPFEVEDEAQTANLIMTSNAITFPTAHSSLWADFVRCVLVKDPQQRPSAAQLMHHPWIVSQINRALAAASAQGRVSSKEVLLQAFPLQPQALQLMQQARHTPWITPPGSQPQPQPQAPSPAPASAPPPLYCPTWAGQQQPPTQPCLHTDHPQVKATTPAGFVSPSPTQQQQWQQQQQQCLPQPISHELHTPTRPSQAAPVPATAPAHGGMSAPHSSSPWSSCRSYSSPTIAATQAAPQQPQQKTGCTATPAIERSSASAMSMAFVDRCRSCMPASRPPLQHSSSSNSSSSSSGLVSAASSFGHAAAAIAAAAEAPGLDRNSNSSAEGAQAGRAVPHGLPRPPAAVPSLSAAQMSTLLQAYDQGTASLQQLLGAVGHSHATAAVRVHGRTGSARSDKQETASADAAQSSSAAEDKLAFGMGQLRVAPGLPDAADSNVHGSDQQRCPQSPAPMAGFKQRSVFHLQRQAWPSSHLGRS